MMSVNDKKLIYIIVALFVCLVVIITIVTKFMFSKPAVKAPPKPVGAAAVRQAVPQVPAEGRLKAKTTETPSGKMPDDLEEMYRVYPEEDVGDNMVAVWSRLGAREKERFIDVLNKQIEAARDTLKAAPDDEKANRLLFISETLKNLAVSNFNYRIKQSIPKRKEKLPQS